MADFKEVIRRETEQCRTTNFPTEDGKGCYRYVVLPFESRMSVQFQDAVVEGMRRMLKSELKRADVILLPEAKAFLLAPLAKEARKEIVLARKRDYHLPDQIVIEQEKAYKGKSLMYCVGLEKGDRPLIVDDIISSGGTEIALIKALRASSYEIVGVGTVYERGEGISAVKRETGIQVKGLARLELLNGRPSITRFYGDQPP